MKMILPNMYCALLVLFHFAIPSSSAAAIEARNVRGKVEDGPFGSKIHTIPRLTPTENYDDHMEDIHAEAIRKSKTPVKKVFHTKSSSKDRTTARTRGDRAGFVFGFGFLSAIATLALFLILLTNKDHKLKTCTWGAVDGLICVFLAVLWMGAFDHMLEFSQIPHAWAIVAALVHALLVLAFVLWASWKLQQDKESLTIFMAIGTHYVCFGAIHFSLMTHEKLFSGELMMGIVGFIAIAIVMGFVAVMVLQGRGRFQGETDLWHTQAEALENKFVAAGLAVIWGVIVRAAIAGEYHAMMKHKNAGEAPNHTATQRNMMLAYGLLMLPINAYLLSFLGRLKSRYATATETGDPGYYTRRLATIAAMFVSATVAWAFILWGEWEFYENLFPDSHITGGLCFAMGSTVFAAIGIYALSRINVEPGSELEGTRDFALSTVSVFLGVGWAACLHVAIEDLAQGYGHPAKFKIVLALVMFAIIAPVYVNVFKPLQKMATAA